MVQPTESDGFPVSFNVTLIETIDDRLKVYGTSNHDNKLDPIDELVFILLSIQTEAYGYTEAYDNLKRAFADWRKVAAASHQEIENIIRPCGLATKKATFIRAALNQIQQDFGQVALTSLESMPDEDVRKYLVGLPGVGNKSASCIMLYAMKRAVFPVDTHTWRVCRRLGLTPQLPKPSARHELELEALVPPARRYSLHVNMLSHGQQTCLTYWPKCSSCVLAEVCPSRDRPDMTWGSWRRPGGGWKNALVLRDAVEIKSENVKK